MIISHYSFIVTVLSCIDVSPNHSHTHTHAQNAKLLLPAYVWILWGFFSTLILFGVFNSAIDVESLVSGQSVLWISIVFSFGWAFYHFVLEGLGFFLCQRGAGVGALARAGWFGGIVGLVIGVAQFMVYQSEWFFSVKDSTWFSIPVLCTYETALFVWYLCMYALPDRMFFRRKAAKFYALYWVLYKPVYIVTVCLMYERIDVGYCLYIVFTDAIFGLLKPWVVYRTLQIDSAYWSGISLDDDKLDENDIRQPLLGNEVNRDVVVSLASELEGLSSMCDVIHISETTLVGKATSELTILGAGGTFKVYSGTYRDKEIALKMIYCVDLTPETIKNYIRESSSLARLRGPNIVHFYGVSVNPPAIGLVLERCYGSLFEFIRTDVYHTMHNETKLFLMADCARAVAMLHRQTPPMLHRDLNSANFLIGKNQVPTWSERDLRRWVVCEGFECFWPEIKQVNLKSSIIDQSVCVCIAI